MAHRRQEKEALRRQREEREAKARAEQQRKRLVGYGGAGLIVIAAIAAILLLAGGEGDAGGPGGGGNFFPDDGDVPEQQVFDVEEAAQTAGCELTQSRSAGRDHTTDPSQRVNYRDNPPTTGRHYEIPAEDGVYSGEPPADTALVHALEHGRVVIWVDPDVSADARSAIRAMSDEDDGFQTLLVRRAQMPYAVAATAWNRDPVPDGTGRTLGCDEWNPDVIDALRSFRDEHRSNGPEPVP